MIYDGPTYTPFALPLGTIDALLAVCDERVRQEELWGQQDHPPDGWLPILAEEFGEVAKAINEGDGDSYREELIHTAAVAVAAIEAWDRASS